MSQNKGHQGGTYGNSMQAIILEELLEKEKRSSENGRKLVNGINALLSRAFCAIKEFKAAPMDVKLKTFISGLMLNHYKDLLNKIKTGKFFDISNKNHISIFTYSEFLIRRKLVKNK